MKNVSTGFGLCVLGLGIAAWPILDRLMPQANAVGIGMTAVSAVAAAATAQDPPAPTIVWYGNHGVGGTGLLYRAWSDGRVEVRGWDWTQMDPCNPGTSTVICRTPWVVLSDAAQGLTFDADLNFDQLVDGVDLGLLLAEWGPAPRNPVPPSDCPLALINP
jgi:hypothetical protein